jgi:hypothetical protein
LHASYLGELRRTDGDGKFLRESNRNPLTGRGDINTYAVFTEVCRSFIHKHGRVGFLIPSGVATDDTTKFFFQDLITSDNLVSLYDFENREGLFPGVHRSYKFCCLTLTGSATPCSQADFVFYALRVEHLLDANRHFTLSVDDITLLNPNTRTCCIFRASRDAELLKRIHRQVPVLVREEPLEKNPWRVAMQRMIHMTDHSRFFKTSSQLESEGLKQVGETWRKGETSYLPLYEAKMIHHFDHRWIQSDVAGNIGGTHFGQREPDSPTVSRYYVPEDLHERFVPGSWKQRWFLGWRDITNTTNERTVVAGIIPWAGIGNTIYVLFPDVMPTTLIVGLVGNLAAFVLDYAARQKVGGTHLSHLHLKQLPVLPPVSYQDAIALSSSSPLAEWVLHRVLVPD